jgi:hypothetical protein
VFVATLNQGEGASADTTTPSADIDIVSFLTDPNLDPRAEQTLSATRHVGSESELASVLGDETHVIILDESSLAKTNTAFLNEQLRSGVAILALGVCVEDLMTATGFVRAVGEFDAVFSEGIEAAQKAHQYPCADYGFVWVGKVDGAEHWADGAGLLAQGSLETDLENLALQAQGLIKVDGEIVTFEEAARHAAEDAAQELDTDWPSSGMAYVALIVTITDADLEEEFNEEPA